MKVNDFFEFIGTKIITIIGLLSGIATLITFFFFTEGVSFWIKLSGSIVFIISIIAGVFLAVLDAQKNRVTLDVEEAFLNDNSIETLEIRSNKFLKGDQLMVILQKKKTNYGTVGYGKVLCNGEESTNGNTQIEVLVTKDDFKEEMKKACNNQRNLEDIKVKKILYEKDYVKLIQVTANGGLK